MERVFLECTLRAALLAVGTAIVLPAMRVKPAAVKHRVWTGVLALMLVLPVWTAWGPKLSLRVLPALPQITANETTTPSAIVPPLTASPALRTREAVLLGIYLLGLCVLLIRLATGTLRARRLAREAVVHDGVRTSPFCSAPVTVGFFHPVVILPEQWCQWPRAQLKAILTHEGEHARRRDSLVQWLALLNRAVFWFHPVAWWLERNLSALAEQACDEVVLARGHNPGEYAEYLLDLARSVAHSGARLKLAGMEMPGVGLPKRIRKILQGGQAARISRARMACVVGICVITCAAFTAGTLARVRQTAADQSAKTERHFDGLQILTPHDGVDFTTFSAHLTETVRRNWWAKMPVQAKEGTKGKVVVRFGIQQGGTLSAGPVVQVSSGNAPLDDAAVSAIRASAPFEHLPKSFKGPNIELALTFFYNEPISDTAAPAQPSTKFVLGDLKIEGDVQDRDGVRDRILNQFKNREYSSAQKLSDAVAEIGIRGDLQDRGYFRTSANVVSSQPLDVVLGNQHMLVTISVDEGEQYYIASLNVYTSDPSMTIPSPEVVHDLIHLKRGDLFDDRELRVGLDRLKLWYVGHGYANDRSLTLNPDFNIDDMHQVIDLKITVSK
jgi:TonB family protein